MTDKTYKKTTWVVLCIIIILLVWVLIKQNKSNQIPIQGDNEEQLQSSANIEDIDDENSDLSNQLGSNSSLVGEWTEHAYSFKWQLLCNNEDNTYLISIDYHDSKECFKCDKIQIKHKDDFLFYDSNFATNDGYFTLKIGETIYYIHKLEDYYDGILFIMPDGSGRVYTNDANEQCFRLFATLDK